MWGQGKRDRLTAVIGEGCAIEGRCHLAGAAIVEGRVTGDLLIADELVVGEQGAITAAVQVKTLLVRGTVTGSIAATERVELAPTARVAGDIETPVLAMADGAIIDGHCRIASLREAQAEGVVVSLVR